MNEREREIIEVSLDDIIPNRFQPRLSFDEQGLNELAESIRQHGIIQPLVLRKIGDKYEIIAGERRYKASYIAGLTKVPAVIIDLNDNESAEVAIVENIQRKDLSPIEEAKSYKKLLDRGYLTQDQLASRMGKNQSTVSNKLRLLNLDEKVQDALLNNKISERHARSLLKLDNKGIEAVWAGTSELYFEVIDEEKIAGMIKYDESGKTATRTYTTTTYYYKTKEIAKATIDSAYATELSQIKNLQVVKGSGKEVTLKADQTDDSFWGKVVPSYWNNEGVITIKNDANMPYHFEAEDVFTTDSDEVVSLYSLLKTTDKEYTFTHGFSNIKDTDLDNTKYPTDIEENCVTTKSVTGKDKQICSKKQTPLMKFSLKLNEDVKPQEEIDEDEIEKNVTLTKDNDKESKENQEEGK